MLMIDQLQCRIKQAQSTWDEEPTKTKQNPHMKYAQGGIGDSIQVQIYV